MMRMSIKLKTFYLIPSLFLYLSTFFSFTHGQTVNGNLPGPVPVNDGKMPMQVKDGDIPNPAKDGNMPKDGNIPNPAKDGNMPMPLKDGNIPLPFNGDLPGMVGSMSERMAKAKLGNGTLIVLAEEQTHRKDPLDRLHYYKGGWNITNRHYHASVAFSSFPFLAIAIVWFMVLGLLMLYACCCSKFNKSYGYSPLAYLLSLIILILFTIVAIVGCGIMFDGEARFLKVIRGTANYIVQQGEKISNGLISVYHYLISAKEVSFNQKFLPQDIISQIDKVTSQLDSKKDFPHLTSQRIKDSLFKVLKPVNVALICITVTMLLVAFLGFLFSVIGWQTWVYTFVTIAWIITTLTFVLCGVFLAFHNLMADTCIAVDEWVQNPMAGSAIKELLPCVDSNYGKNMTEASKSVASGINELLNTHISLVANANGLPPQAKPLYYNQSGPLLPTICDPYTVEMTKQPCGEGKVALDKAIQEWNKQVCQVSAEGICSTPGRLTPDLYKQFSSAVNVSYALYSYGPFLVSLIDCSMIRETLNDVHQYHCPGLRKYTKRVYIGLVIATVSVMFSLISWVFYGRERRHRKYTKRIDKVQAVTPLVKD